MRVRARVPARMSTMVPGWKRSTIVIVDAKIDPEELPKVELNLQRTCYLTENGSASEQSNEEHVIGLEDA